MPDQNFRGRGYARHSNVIRGATLNVGNPTVFQKELPMSDGWYKLNLRVNIALTVGTGTTPLSEGELRFIKKVLLKTDRGEVICDLPGRALYKFATYINGSAPRKDAIAAATGTYRVSLPIIFADPYMNRPEDTILDTKRYNSCTLEVTLGGVSDLLGVVGTATVTATMDVDILHSLGPIPKEAEPHYHISYTYRQPVDASSTTEIDMDRAADLAIMRVLTHESSSGTAGVPFSGNNADDVKDIVKIIDQDGATIVKDVIHEVVQDINKDDATLESIIAGCEIFDFVRDRSITSALSTGNKSTLKYQWTNKAGVAANDIVSLATQSIRTLK